MKKTLLFVAALLFAAGAMAQDIWLGAERTDSNGDKYFTISKNGAVVETCQNLGYDYDIPSLIAGDNGEVYYLRHSPDKDTGYTRYTDVYKHDGTSSTLIYNCPFGQEIFLRDLAYSDGDVYAAGQCEDQSQGGSSRLHGFITKNGSALYTLDQHTYLNGVCVANDVVFTCGGTIVTEEYVPSDCYATVWRNDQKLAYFPRTNYLYSEAYDIVCVDGTLFVCGSVWSSSGKYFGALWKTSVTPSSSGEPKQLELIQTLEGDDDTQCYYMYEDAGFIYIAYHKFGEERGVMRYNTYGGAFTQEYEFVASDIVNGSVIANNHGVYVTAKAESKYFKDGQGVSTPIQGAIRKIAVTNTRTPIVYDLPFYEGFEYCHSHWDDWTSIDYDNNNSTQLGYWERRTQLNTNISAVHGFGSAYQKGSLISPAIRIPSGSTVNLTLATRVKYYDNLEQSTLYVVRNPNGVLVTEENLSALQSVMVYDFRDDDFDPDGNWSRIDINLSSFAGEVINLNFVYQGTNAHDWYIDEIEITATPTGVEDAQVTNLALYPNPANDIIHIEGLESNTEVKIYNTLGELVKTVVVGSNAEINISELSAGLYVVRCGETSLRFVKE